MKTHTPIRRAEGRKIIAIIIQRSLAVRRKGNAIAASLGRTARETALQRGSDTPPSRHGH